MHGWRLLSPSHVVSIYGLAEERWVLQNDKGLFHIQLGLPIIRMLSFNRENQASPWIVARMYLLS